MPEEGVLAMSFTVGLANAIGCHRRKNPIYGNDNNSASLAIVTAFINNLEAKMVLIA
jgi:hypothetical protein